ncbi:MAG: hypothetical protein ACI8PZ_004287 [Myxococcota bacterium]|jgi:hypothetical protein
MTPTLRGRWHTRLLLNALVGIPVTAPFCLLALPLPLSAPLPYLMLAIVTAVGLGLDVVYDGLQQRRWDHDWPVTLQLGAGLLEGLICYLVLFGWCGGLAWANPLFLVLFPVHFAAVWLPSFLLAQGPLRVLLPSWRYTGGELRSRSRR